MTIRIDPKRTVKAQYTTAWSMSLRGSPKLTIICGNCTGQFATRDYVSLSNRGGLLTACCPYCGYWNITGLVLA